jgi:hypothetical protein
MTMNTKFPLAIQMLREALAPDQGQGRADSLLAILGVGPGYVRQHIGALDALPGIVMRTSAPGTLV